RAGGGRGGAGSFLTTASTPRGGNGFGAFSTPDGGGQGGEASYAMSGSSDHRRGAGGGGGALGHDIYYDHDFNPMTVDRQCQTLIGMDGEDGFGGSLQGTGAKTHTGRAMGGSLGPKPFSDSRAGNDFFGSLLTANNVLIEGELSQSMAGSGGGGGGDASRITASGYPNIPFQQTGDEKGAGGGGGGGGITILALGPIELGNSGRIAADGGHGGAGESVIFFDRVGGGAGGGSGGHILLSSASYVEVLNQSENSGSQYSDLQAGHLPRALSALGGQGGAGHDNRGGATETGPTQWRCDAIDLARLNVDGIFVDVFPGVVGTSEDVPPLDGQSACFRAVGMPDWLDPEGPVLGAGGDGSPGIIQIHVPDPALNIRFGMGQTWTTADVTQYAAPRPLGWRGVGTGNDTPVPFIESTSVARSKWIPLGLARVAPGGAPDDQVEFFFEGTSPTTGSVLRGVGGQVQALGDVIPAAVLQPPGNLPYVELSGLTLHLDGSGLNQSYKANPYLLNGFDIVLNDNVSSEVFPVAAASLGAMDELILTVGSPHNLIDDFIVSATGPVSAALRPKFFRMVAGGQADQYPNNTEVTIWFDATVAGANGMPDPAQSFSASNGGQPATNANDLNAQTWDYFRVGVIFELSTNGAPVMPQAPRPSLDFLRLPFRF
ncbi:MAG: hypothetical protein P1V35_13620, partial [Planctomycetota bacterium]|nr:hypothetical protein [Planctomycetota bacterium]